MAKSEWENRLAKIEGLKTQGEQPFKARFTRTHNLKQASELPDDQEQVSIAGRVIAIRNFGKLCFLTLSDWYGKLQIALERESFGKLDYKRIVKLLDVADHIGATGKMFTTQRGEKTLLAKELSLLSKALRPLPEKWHGLTDVEARYRYRYLDLIMNQETRNVFKVRSKVIKALRSFLDTSGFEEVDTPVLVQKKSGALARAFNTHHNALNMKVFLRIAPETYLKRCIAGGYDRVYEMARVFRNEGMDASHLQDFTMLEYYCAYWDFEDNMRFTEELISTTIQQVCGSLEVKFADNVIDFTPSYERKSFRELVQKYVGLDIDKYTETTALLEAITKKGIEIENAQKLGRGNLIDQLYKKLVRPKLIKPIFITHHPIDVSPLARKSDNSNSITDRFQLVVNGWEIVNAYSEIIDPIDQRERLEKQAAALDHGDDDALCTDEDFVRCLEHGLPPVSGWGMGIDRFVALLTGKENLRDVVLFPLMKPIENTPAIKAEIGKQEFPSLEGLNISLQRAEELFNEFVTSANLRKHSIASAAVMRTLARHFNQNEEKWYVLGLLHDLDFETHKEPAEHGLKTAEILRAEGVEEEIVQIVLSHNAEGLGIERDTRLGYLLSAGESITGLIAATALVYPDKKLASVKVKSVAKRMKKKDFARKVSRELIRLCEDAGLPLNEFIGLSLKGMQEVSEELGL